MADTSTSSEYASMEQIKSQLTKEAYRENAPKVDQIRKEIAKSVFEARKELTGKQKDIFKRRDELTSTIDKFWPTTLERSGLNDSIDEADKEALSHLTNLHVEYATEDPREYTATFTFSDKNPYFKETELKKTFKVPAEIKKELPYDLAAPVTSEPITVSWTDDKHNLVKKNPKPDMTKMEEYDDFGGLGSFFNFFTASAEDDDGIAELVLQTYENALEIYAGFAQLDGGEDSDDEDDDEEENADPTAEIDLGDSEDEKPKTKKRKA